MTLAQCIVLSILVSIVASSPALEHFQQVSQELDRDQGLYILTFRRGAQPSPIDMVINEETLLFDTPMPFDHEYVHKWPRNGMTFDRINGTEVVVTTDSHNVDVLGTKADAKGVKLVIRNSPTLSKTKVTIRHIRDRSIGKSH